LTIFLERSNGIAPHVEASGCGVVVAPEISKIKSGLIELIQRRSEWKEMGLRGRNYALEHLRWDKIAAETFTKYQKLLR
jgi:glycosyltransferase involved in cell wall biosynthesis